MKKSERHIPRGLKSAREIKNKRLIGTAEAVPFQNIAESSFFGRLLQPRAALWHGAQQIESA